MARISYDQYDVLVFPLQPVQRDSAGVSELFVTPFRVFEYQFYHACHDMS